jgi:hypothetical protein
MFSTIRIVGGFQERFSFGIYLERGYIVSYTKQADMQVSQLGSTKESFIIPNFWDKLYLNNGCKHDLGSQKLKRRPFFFNHNRVL